MDDEDRFSELYSKIEGTSSMVEPNPEFKKQFEEDIKEYKTLLKRRYEESINDDEAEEGSFYYYNGCHGYLESDCEPYEDIPESVRDYILEKNKPVTFIIHKKTPIFTSVIVGKFTETGSLAFQVDRGEYVKYLKLEYKLNEDTENIELTIYVYNNSAKPIEIKDNEGIPNIRLEYNNKDFNMGYFPLIQGSTYDIFYVSETKFTDGGFFQGTYVFPKLVADYEYTTTGKKGSYFSSSLFSMEESLLERCFSNLLDHYKDKERGEEFEGDSVEEIEINIFNSSCLYSTKEVSKDIIKQYPQWAKVMAEEIKTSLEDNPLLRGSKRRKKSGSRKKKSSKKKRKKKHSKRVRRSSKKKKKNKRSKRTKNKIKSK